MLLTGKRKQNGQGGVIYRFEGDITVYTVKKLKRVLVDEIAKNDRLELDLSGVKKFDSAGFQLLLLLNREAERNKKTFALSERSGEVSRILGLYGVEW